MWRNHYRYLKKEDAYPLDEEGRDPERYDAPEEVPETTGEQKKRKKRKKKAKQTETELERRKQNWRQGGEPSGKDIASCPGSGWLRAL